MKFNFNKDVSRIFDYLLFPRLFFFNKEYEETDNDETKELIHEEYKEMVEHLIDKLNPYEDKIKLFYQKSVYSSYDYCNILIHAYPVENYKDEHKYLADIVSDDDEVFKNKIIKALVTMEEDDDIDKVFDESNATDYINSLKIDSANKWNLFLMVQNPKKHLNDFITLLKNVEGLFYDTYKKFENDVVDVGEDVAKRISKNTNKSFKEITQNLINYEFNGEESCNLYVSAIFPYSLSLRGDCVIVWGLKSEYSFKKVSEINENQLTQRVKVFKALGDKTRYEVLKMIASGFTSIKKIADNLDVSSATISYHINEFLTSGIVYINRDKDKKAGYKIDYNKISEVIENFKVDLGFEE